MTREILTVELVILLAGSCGCAPAADREALATFNAALETFDNATSQQDFLSSAQRYDELLQQGIVSGAVYYNQGNAFMNAQQRGRAIACYRQAQRYLPRDPQLRANLQNALGGEERGFPPRSIPATIFFWGNWISYGEKFQLTGLLASFSLLLGAAALWSSERRRWGTLAGMTLTLALLCGASAAYDWIRFDFFEYGVVVRDGVMARKGDGLSYQPAFEQMLREGTEFTVVARRAGWLHVEMPESQRGWIEIADAVVYSRGLRSSAHPISSCCP